ncbi:hypothetical protein [Bifidobacterium stellenboschense]|uniref:hypothetical protein n=1 Tax=Bifidobacterium stellenboschense TaxID=762211 RepID=UPI0012EB3ED9|nr:hypothetical protein [Bifidobacterium stellenboschense]
MTADSTFNNPPRDSGALKGRFAHHSRAEGSGAGRLRWGLCWWVSRKTKDPADGGRVFREGERGRRKKVFSYRYGDAKKESSSPVRFRRRGDGVRLGGFRSPVIPYNRANLNATMRKPWSTMAIPMGYAVNPRVSAWWRGFAGGSCRSL